MMSDNPFGNALAGLITRANANLRINPGDYSADGLIYCGKCRTPKQAVIEFPFGKQLVAQMCECEAKAFEASLAAERRERRITEIREKAFPENLYKTLSRLTIENDDGTNPDLSACVKKYTDNFERYLAAGKGIMFHGKRGRGKSYAMCAIVNRLIDMGYTAKFTNFTAIANRLSELRDGRQEYLEGFARFDVLAIDDLDAERNTDFMQEVVYNVIDIRATSKKPLLLTTNLTGEQMGHEQDPTKARIYSRIYEMCFTFEVVGVDRRFNELQRANREFRLD